MLKLGLIGLGFMGKAHLGVYQKLNDVELAAVSDRIAERLQGNLSFEGNIAAEENMFDFSKIGCYENADDLIRDEKIDFVDICLPTHLHAEFTVKALEAGKDVLCEKPMGNSLEECNRMIAAAKASGKKLMIAQCLRFWPEYEVLKDYVESGELGKLTALTCFRGGGTPIWSGGGWILQKNKGGGALLDMHIHDIDMIAYLLGLPKGVFSSGKNLIENSGIDIVSTNYLYPDGPVVNATCNWALNGEFGFNMTYLAGFEKGNITYDAHQEPTIKINPDEGKSFTPQLHEGTGYSREIDYFVKAIINDTSIERVTPEQARDSVKVALAEMLSVERHQVVEIEKVHQNT